MKAEAVRPGGGAFRGSGAARYVLAALAGILVCSVLYGQSVRFEFTHLDDTLYVSGNPHLRGGLNAAAIQWAFGADLFYDSPNADRWQPLVFLSRLADVHFFGFDPGAHHLMNVVWHTANTLLLFFLLTGVTGAFWRSLVVMLFFAVHPLQAESVAWVTARKDLVSGFFALLACHSYRWYLLRPSRKRMTAVAGVMAMAIMSKSVMLVLPVLFLALDVWPFERFSSTSGWKTLRNCLAEKKFLFLISLAALPVPFLGVPAALGYTRPDVIASKIFPRIFFYLSKFAWPFDLGFYGPDAPGRAAWGIAAAAAVVFLLLTVSAAGQYRRPWILSGWLWFNAGIFPVLGLEFPGDRFMYLPLAGLAWSLVWTAGSLKHRAARAASGFMIVTMFAGFAFLSFRQTSHWRTSETLFKKALQVNPLNYLAMNDLGVYYASLGRHQEAAVLFTRALGKSAQRSEFYNNLGASLLGLDKEDEALEVLSKAEKLNPYNARTQNNLANLYLRRGREEEAREHLNRALQIEPGYSHALNNLGVMLSRVKKWTEADQVFVQAVKSDPSNATAYKNWAQALLEQGRQREALECYFQALRRTPGDAYLYNNTGTVFSEMGRPGDALPYYQKALVLDPGLAEAAFNAGHALHQMGKIPESRVFFEQALSIHPDYAKARMALESLLTSHADSDDAVS